MCDLRGIAVLGTVSFQFPADCAATDTDYSGYCRLCHPCFTQASYLVSLFLCELLVVLVVVFHDRPWLTVGVETISSTHSLFKPKSVALVVLLQHLS